MFATLLVPNDALIDSYSGERITLHNVKRHFNVSLKSPYSKLTATYATATHVMYSVRACRSAYPGVHVADIALDLLALLIFLFAGGWDYVGVSVAIFVTAEIKQAFLWVWIRTGCRRFLPLVRPRNFRCASSLPFR